MKNGLKFDRLGVMLDFSRNAVMTVGSVKRWIDLMADFGYNTLMLYLEDTYEIKSQPYFGHLRGRYSQQELKEIDGYAAGKGIEVIPCIQTLAHLSSIFRWPQYSKIHDCEDILLVGDPDTYALIEDAFRTVSDTFRSKNVNIGMDEAHMLGRGKYLDENGCKDCSQIMIEHLIKVAEIGARYGFNLTMWGDMFFRPLNDGQYYGRNADVSDEIKSKIPGNVDIVYWDYYFTDKEHYDWEIKAHNSVKNGCWFAGGAVSWNGFAPNNKFSIDACRAAIPACIDNGVKNVFITVWGDDGAECSKYAVLPTLYYAAQLARGVNDDTVIKKGFEQKTGISFDGYMLIDLPGTPNEYPGDGIDTFNPEKYLLYNDCFMGRYDSTVSMGDAASYALCAEKLESLTENREYGYLFAAMKALCEVLSIKADIGNKTRSAYLSGDRTALQALAEDYAVMIQKTEEFYVAFRRQWMTDNKPHGFDVQDVRIGGLICRMKHCRERLTEYLNGDLQRIEELEEPLLQYAGGGADFVPERVPRDLIRWRNTVSANQM